eukprot:9804536-Prorocentrum_lima.AAC.1
MPGIMSIPLAKWLPSFDVETVTKAIVEKVRSNAGSDLRRVDATGRRGGQPLPNEVCRSTA